MKIKLKKSTKTKKFIKPTKREKQEGEITVGVRWFYRKDFAKALGKAGSGKGRARRNDVKQWASSVLDRAAKDLIGQGMEDSDASD